MKIVKKYTYETLTTLCLGKQVHFISDCELFPNFDVNVQVNSISISESKEILFNCKILNNRKNITIGSKMKNLKFQIIP